ncbi:MAG: thioredoxin domain-containing protein [Halobacteriales archaeon]|nr:thioredoxin domain-containing protein [Halobacteriales archaeon]
MDVRRRGFLSVGALALTGCLGGGSAEGDGGGGATFEDHPATRGIEDAAVIGDESSGRRIVAFEDPSCSTCARFSRETFPSLEEDAENGEIAFYLRAIPLIRPWSETATPALYATHQRDAEAFWTLLESYYENQGSVSTGNVKERTREFLADTPVSADEVLSDVSDGTQDEKVRMALDIFEENGPGQTPTFFLFDSDGFVTETSGARSYDVFATALEL